METAEITLYGRQLLGEIRGPLFGQFLELAGRCVYGGLVDPESPLARPDGLRTDVVAMLRELNPTHLRYPGGCAAAYFDWQDLVGPRPQRPSARLFRRFRVPQSTAFGIPEVHALCQEVGAELYYTVNAHTQSPEDAANLVEYLNAETSTRYADLRRAHGRREPYGVRLFSLGNEIYGDWQPGQKTATEYTAWCREAIRQMKLVDPEIRVAVCGLGRPNPEWDRTVLKGLIDQVDLIAVHNYFGRPGFADSLCAAFVMEEMIQQLRVNIQEAMDGCLSRKDPPLIALDEWNVWYRSSHGATEDLEERYTYTDALTVASLFHTVLRNVRWIGLSNIALFTNTLGLVFTDRNRAVRQTIFYPARLMREVHRGQVITTTCDGPTFCGKHERFFCGTVDPDQAQKENRPTLIHYREVPALDVLASLDRARGCLAVSIVQRLEQQPVRVRFRFRGIAPATDSPLRLHRLTGGEDLAAVNALDAPDRVGVRTHSFPFTEEIELPPASWTVLEFGL